MTEDEKQKIIEAAKTLMILIKDVAPRCALMLTKHSCDILSGDFTIRSMGLDRRFFTENLIIIHSELDK